MSNNYPYENDVTVEVNGKAHNSWKSYDIDSDFLIPADAFKFDLGVPSNSTVLPDFSGAEVKVRINGELVMTGIVDTTQHTISKTNRTYSINGRDRASILVDCSAPITNVKGLTVLDAVKKIVEPLGIKKVALRAENNPTLDKVDIDVGETAWNAAMRCANSAGLHLWFEPNGELIVGGADYSTPPVATLCCMKDGKRNNFEQADLTFDVSNRFSEVTFLAQSHGKQGQDNKNDLKWVYNDPEMTTYKPKTVVVSDVDNLEALQKWAKKYIADSVLEGFTLTIVVPDHKMQDGTLWQPGQRVHVICEEYEIDAIFFLMGRRFMLSRNGGTQTELRFKQDGIWTPDAYNAKAEKARKRKGKKGKKNQGDLISTNGQGGWTK
ncbi:phage tail protein [Haemophilus sp. HMSC073C03]|jgi:bacteriophage Mu P family protein|uniref:43 kDa tail protein n=1 Tax=Myoviridae sp. ctniE2 TaxID=2825172 RepID=A0A8S5PGQ5_9CAUD|nr:phage tail protein [Haemophilus sp. HMSC073C03]OFQ20883.1 phage tail protein [Haemophilus sp. HMSC073C03]DAE06351.1 MAG TPA: 43 kDa tail protein [Myoviridae sp. ctniE2]